MSIAATIGWPSDCGSDLFCRVIKLYAHIGPLMFQTLVDAFCMNVTLPKSLADNGFPKGLQTSFSLFVKQLPHAGITIPIRYIFKGTISILGLQATVDINTSVKIRNKM